MSGPPPRKVPRIISRVKPKQERTVVAQEVGPVPSSNHEALVKELSNEKVVIKDGCLVAVQHIEKGSVHGIVTAASAQPRRIIIDTVPPDHVVEPYTENPLPGVADEVESYPCKFCPDQVFLTSVGLEKHGRNQHPNLLDELLMDIHNIKEEWERRERERHRHRERMMTVRARQESIAQAAVRSAQERITNPSANSDISINTHNTERFEACRICSILINVKHPTAMENHLGAHRKNEQLRNHLLNEYGPEIVRRLTCHECRLVFTDQPKLDAHMDTSHVRRRKFVCKYCGHVCMTMADLNSHKVDVHAIMQPSNSYSARMRQQQLLQMQREMSPERRFARLRAGLEENVCSTSCSECGLRLVRPSLLVRHMLRVHSKDTFSCEVVTRGVPNIRIEVENGRLSWWCCDTKFLDRNEFLYHRRAEHLEQMMLGHSKIDGQTNSEKILQMAQAHLPMEAGTSTYSGQLVTADDGTMQVMLPEGVDPSGELYVVMVDDDEPDEKGAYLRDGLHDVHNPHDDVGEDDGTVQITVEQYEQLRQQYGDDINNMQIMFVNDGDDGTGELLDDDAVDVQDMQDTKPYVHHMEPELTNEEIFEP